MSRTELPKVESRVPAELVYERLGVITAEVMDADRLLATLYADRPDPSVQIPLSDAVISPDVAPANFPDYVPDLTQFSAN